MNKLFAKSALIALGVMLSAVTYADVSLKIMSFNIQQPYNTNWDGRKGLVTSIINTEKPDVIGSQEAHAYMRDYILQQTGYVAFGCGRDGGDNGEASFIFYKGDKYTLDDNKSGNFWLSYKPTSPSKIGGDYNRICSYVRLIEKSTNQAFYLFNVHNYMPGESDYRMQAAKILVQRIKDTVGDEPVFLTGDFNSAEGDAVTQWLKSGSDNPLKFRDSYRDIDPSGNVTTGFGVKFDYIYYPNSDKYSCTSSWVVTNPAGASDHMPIVANVKYSGSSNPVVVESVSFKDIKTTYESDDTYTLDVDYVAKENRDVYLCMYDNAGTWNVIGEVHKAVTEGSGSLRFVMPVDPKPAVGEGYIFKCDIRPTGGAWDSFIDMKLAEDITITVNEDELDFSGCNIMDQIDAEISYYAPDWNETHTASASVENNVVEFSFPTATTDLWMSQAKIRSANGINLTEGVQYTLSCTITSNVNIADFDIKVEEKVNSFFGKANVALQAGVPCKIKVSETAAALSNAYIIIGTGGHGDNSIISISNIILRESSCEGVNTDINEEESENISIYPNPVTDVLHINSSNEEEKHNVINTNGIQVLQTIGNNVNVSGLSSGLYFINVQDKYYRFIKQ